MDIEPISRSGREFALALDSSCDFETPYTFYYDETNNIRKYHNENGCLNYQGDSNFVLGGIVFEEEPVLEGFFASLGLQDNIEDVKFKHIAKGDYFTCLKSRRLKQLLTFLNESDFYIHYHAVNFFYFALVDILDSALASCDHAYGFEDILALKDIFYMAAMSRKDIFVEVFHHFSYPNVPEDKLDKFVYHMCKQIKPFKQHKKGIEAIIKLLTEAAADNDMPFIVHEMDNILIESFAPFYQRPLSAFHTSEHYFDHELEIEEEFLEVPLMFGSSNLYANCHFLDSEKGRLIQLSDIVVGLIGKLYEYINTTESQRVSSEYNSLTDKQRECYRLVSKVINRSLGKNPAFVYNTISNGQRECWRKVLSYT